MIAQIYFWAVHSSLSIRLAEFWLGLVIASFLFILVLDGLSLFHVALLREMVSTNLLHLIQLLKRKHIKGISGCVQLSLWEMLFLFFLFLLMGVQLLSTQSIQKQAVDRFLLFLQALIVSSVNVMTGRCEFQYKSVFSLLSHVE